MGEGAKRVTTPVGVGFDMDFKAAGQGAETAAETNHREAARARRLSTPLRTGPSASPQRSKAKATRKKTTVSAC